MVTNPAIRSLSDNLIIRRLADGHRIFGPKPDFKNRTLSPAQRLRHQKFREASAYACDATKSQPIYAKAPPP